MGNIDRRPINTIKNLDFKNIEFVMKLLNWKVDVKKNDDYIHKLPDEFELIQIALETVTRAYDEKACIYSSGFQAHYKPPEDGVDEYVVIKFVLCESYINFDND